jgi:hypothetical protein
MISARGPQAVRKVAAETSTPLVDLHARSYAAVQAMGPVEAMKFAQRPPPPEVVEAGKTGTTIGANPAPAAPGAAAPAAQNNTAVEPMGQAKLSFDYTHLGPVGADYFAVQVADELAKVAPKLRRYLIP